MKVNKWKNSRKSIAFIVLSVWPIGFLLNIKFHSDSLTPGESSAAFGSAIFFYIAVAALLFAVIFRFFAAPKSALDDDKRKIQAYTCAFIAASLTAISSIYTGSWFIGLPISLVLILLAIGIKKGIKGTAIGLVILSGGFIFAESYFGGSTAWIWMYSFIYWTSLRYMLTLKVPQQNIIFLGQTFSK